MSKKSPVAIFLAATALLAANALQPNLSHAGEGEGSMNGIHHAGEGGEDGEGGEGGEVGEGEMGGLTEWSTDQDIDADSKPDEDAKKTKEKAKRSNICIPIGEGENCW